MSASSTTTPLTLKAKLILGLVGVIGSALLLEVMFRLFVSAKRERSWNDRPYAYILPSGAQTLQDAEPAPKEPGTFRIAVVGDSFTFGPNMQLVDTFPKKLEHMLNQNVGSPRTQVLNRGVNGSSTENEVEIVRKVLQERPDVLVLQITLNDAEPHILSDEERKELFGAPWLRWRIFSAWRSLGFIASRFHNSQTVRRYIDYHSRFFRDPASRERFEISIRRISHQAQGAGVPLVALVFPLFDFPINDHYPFAETHSIINEILARNGVKAIDLRAAYSRIPPERLQVIPGVDNHPNEIAHRIAAERLLAVLISSGLIPNPNIPTRVFRERTGMKSRSISTEKVWRKAASPVLPSVGPATDTGQTPISNDVTTRDPEGSSSADPS